MQAGQAAAQRSTQVGPQRDEHIDESLSAVREATPQEVISCIGNYTTALSNSGMWRFNFHIRPSGLSLPDSAFHPACFMLRMRVPGAPVASGNRYWVPSIRDIRRAGPVLYMQFHVSDLEANPYGQMVKDMCELHIGHAVARFTGGRRLAYGESR